MELMVVIGIISIIGLIVAPDFKKIYEDFKVEQTADELVSVMNACRSYYLIFNEFPPDSPSCCLPKNLSPFMPSCFFNKDLESDQCYSYNISVYGGSGYDVENWLHDKERKAALITMYFGTDRDRSKVKTKLDKIFQPNDLRLWQWGEDYELGIYFQELRECNENRYY